MIVIKKRKLDLNSLETHQDTTLMSNKCKLTDANLKDYYDFKSENKISMDWDQYLNEELTFMENKDPIITDLNENIPYVPNTYYYLYYIYRELMVAKEKQDFPEKKIVTWKHLFTEANKIKEKLFYTLYHKQDKPPPDVNLHVKCRQVDDHYVYIKVSFLEKNEKDPIEFMNM